MEHLKEIKNCLVATVKDQLSDLKKINAKELGEVVDMIKDLEEAMYYYSIIQAMEHSKKSESEEKSTNISYYMENDKNINHYVPYMEYAPYMIRDKEWREDHLNNGRSYYSRRMYMESKLNGSDDQKSAKELEHYMKDLGEDLTDMIVKSTPEEKQMLSNKLQQLAMKVIK